jgi:hypothetical protein
MALRIGLVEFGLVAASGKHIESVGQARKEAGDKAGKESRD